MPNFSFQIHPSFRPRQMPKIDRPNSRLYGLVAGMDVEATGHGLCCDVTALEQIAALANAHPKGVSGRFGHPGMSENATGRKVQLAYNWRVIKGDKPGAPGGPPHTYLLHDAQLMDAARTSPAFAQDPIEYIMRMAEQYPQHFGESLVLSGDAVWTTKDGQELPLWEEVPDEEGEEGATVRRNRPRPANALTKVPVMRPTAIHFCDFVNDGAITHTGLFPLASTTFPPNGLRGGTFTSIFTAENTPNHLLDHLFATVDDLRRRFNIPLDALTPKVKRLLRLYLDSRRLLDASTARTIQPIYFQPAHLHEQMSNQQQKEENSMSTRRHRLTRQRSDRRREFAQEPAAPQPAPTEAEELALETDESLGHASAILDQAEQIANTMVQSTVALTDAPMLASAAQVAHLQGQLDQHTDQLHDLTAHLKKLSELLVKNMELTNVLQRNIARANGEPVITQRVPLLGATGWEQTGHEGFQFQQPAPGAWAAAQQPVSTDQRHDQLPTGLDPNSPEARAIRTQQRRAQQTRQ